MGKTLPAGLGGPSRKIKRFKYPSGLPVREGTVKKDYRNWHADFTVPRGVITRQQKRRDSFVRLWLGFSGPNALRDEHGIVPRRVRRDIAKNLRKRLAAEARVEKAWSDLVKPVVDVGELTRG